MAHEECWETFHTALGYPSDDLLEYRDNPFRDFTARQPHLQQRVAHILLFEPGLDQGIESEGEGFDDFEIKTKLVCQFGLPWESSNASTDTFMLSVSADSEWRSLAAAQLRPLL